MSALGAGQIIGIALATCGAVSLSIILVSWFVYHRRRQRSILRHHAQASQSTVPVVTDALGQYPNHYHGTRYALHPSSAWAALPSYASLPQHTQPPSGPSVPMQRLRTVKFPSPRRGFPLKKSGSHQLSAILESPMLASHRLQRDIMTERNTLSGDPAALHNHEFPPQDPNAFSDSPFCPDPLFSWKTSPDGSRRLELRRSAFGDSGLSSILDRTKSEPSLITWNLERRLSLPKTGMDRRVARHRSRSFSLCSQRSGKAPQHSPPPLPLSPAARETRSRSAKRASSIITVSSTSGTSASSILLTDVSTPQMRARAEFSQRNPDVALGAQVRKGHMGLDDLFATESSGESKLYRKRSKAPKLGRSLITDKPPSPIHPALRERPPVAGGVISGCRTELDLHDALSGSGAPASTGASEYPVSKTPPTMRATPKRRRLSNKTSASGSPPERLRPRESQSGMTAHRASDTSSSTRGSPTNPFQWDPSFDPSHEATRPSALKGSPRAKSKGHRRQNTVRILIEPTTFDFDAHPGGASYLERVVDNGSERKQEALDYANTIADVKLRPENSQYLSSEAAWRLSSNLQQEPTPSSQRLASRSSSNDRMSTVSSALTIPFFPQPCAVEDADRGQDDVLVMQQAQGGTNPNSYHLQSQHGDDQLRSPPAETGGGLRAVLGEELGLKDVAGPSSGQSDVVRIQQKKQRRLPKPRMARPTSDGSAKAPSPRSASPHRLTAAGVAAPANPMDTKPTLLPPAGSFDTQLAYTRDCNGSEPVQDILRSVQTLRRMDSEKLDRLDTGRSSYGEREFMQMGSPGRAGPVAARGSPGQPNAHRWLGHHTEESDSGKENSYGGEMKSLGNTVPIVKPLRVRSPARSWD